MTDKPLHADIVTAVMDCIEREGMISRGKLEQAVAGVLATQPARFDDGPFALNPLTSSLRERGLVRQTYMGKEFYVDTRELSAFSLAPDVITQEYPRCPPNCPICTADKKA